MGIMCFVWIVPNAQWAASRSLAQQPSVSKSSFCKLKKDDSVQWVICTMLIYASRAKFEEICRSQIFSHVHCRYQPTWEPTCTFFRSKPWEMLSAVRKADTRWVIDPASPQWGRNRKVLIPLSLQKLKRKRIKRLYSMHSYSAIPGCS